MVYSLTLYDDTYAQLLAALPDLAQCAKPIPSITTSQAWYIACLVSGFNQRDKATKSLRPACSNLYHALLRDKMSLDPADVHEAIDSLKAGKPYQLGTFDLVPYGVVYVNDDSDIPW